MRVDCPHCGGAGFVDDDPVALLRAECERLAIPIRYTDLVTETGAETLMELPANSLRRSNVRFQIGFKQIANRRFYSLQSIADFLT